MSLRSCTCVLMLATMPGWTAAFAAQPPVEVFASLSAEAVGIILTPGSARGATELAAAPRCHPTKRRAALVVLRWQPAGGADAEVGGARSAGQRVELTKLRDGFSTDRFEATRRLTAVVDAVAVDSPEPGIHYYWRVLTLTPDGWSPSDVSRFEVPVCPWDEPDLGRFETNLGDDREDPSRDGAEGDS